MKNQELAKIFYEIADILELENIQWKPRAYRKAAQAIESLSDDVGDIYKEKGIKGLKEIPGVGESIAKKIEEYLKKGRISKYEKLKKKFPKGLDKLMEVMGMGPKKAMILYKKLKIKNITDLEKAIKKHKLQKLEGFGEKTEKGLLEGIEFRKKSKDRYLLGMILPMSEHIVNELKKLKEVHQCVVGGSLRRMEETVGDIDILITTNNPGPVMNRFTSLPDVKRVIAKGTTKSIVILKENIQADVRVVPDKSFGAALQYFTGNKNHNIHLRKIAMSKGWKLSEYGLFKKSDGKFSAKTEDDVYKKLGLKIAPPPEMREDWGEIETSIKGKLPHVVDYNEIKGDFHIHTTWSDGHNTIEEMAKACKNLGYKYICIGDHSKTRAIAHGLNEDSLLKQIEEIKRIDKNLDGIKIFCGMEVDILKDGILDLDDSVLKKLDIVTASVHSGFKMSKKDMTNRIIKALENKYVDILGHPTGRLINERPGYDINLDEILKVAKENKKILEINAFQNRLDLKASDIKKAVEAGVKLVVNTDAHSTDHLRFMRLGIGQARKGWATSNDIVNTYNLNELKKVFPKIK